MERPFNLLDEFPDFVVVEALVAQAPRLHLKGRESCSGVYNGVGVVKHIFATRILARAGRGVKGGSALFAGPFIADP
ncbi:MAG: hypothetical protein KGM47_03685 [Acidobacteriota bacterium]|nr:hypothetical protein [Acidobacteriota bacterium]